MGQTKWGQRNWGDFKWSELDSYIDIAGIKNFEFFDLSVEDILTSEINTASFGVIKSAVNKPKPGNEVIVYIKGTKIFAGRIVDIQETKLNRTNFFYECFCSDYQIELDKKLVNKTYTSSTVSAIISDIISTYASGFTVANVINPGITISKIIFSYLYPSDCIKQICDISGYDWYIDYNKDLHVFETGSGEESAPIELEDNGTEFDNLDIKQDYAQIRNKIYIRGGYQLSSTYTQDTITAVAGQSEFKINYFAHSLTVTVNSVGKTIGVENLDAPGSKDFLFNYQEKLLKKDTITINAGDTIIMTYKYEVPVLCVAEDKISQTNMAAIEGGDGIHEFYITDENLTTTAMAKERAKIELLHYADPLIYGNFTTFRSDFRTGQLLHLNLTSRNMIENITSPSSGTDEFVIIQKVTAKSIGGNQLEYTIEFGTYSKGLNHLLIELLDKTRKKDIRTDETFFYFVQNEERVDINDFRTVNLNGGFVGQWFG